ncbi:hypothetical protein ZWY2020_021695 [Hordeum vulgare]|nr:hypothetical protein ZWY2020_021695 [Hordeum vulgare]
MAKRKSMSSKMASRKKPAPKLDTSFCCPFCNHPDSVACTIDLKLFVASAVCYVCQEAYTPRRTTSPNPSTSTTSGSTRARRPTRTSTPWTTTNDSGESAAATTTAMPDGSD